MKTTLSRRRLLVKKSPLHGYGVFALEPIPKDAIIEETYALFCKTHHSDYQDYYFQAEEGVALPLGYGAIYNHADTPNAYYEFDLENHLLIFRANRLIKKKEEILISYGNTWFSDRNAKCKHRLRDVLKRSIRPYLKIITLFLKFSFVASSIGFLIYFMSPSHSITSVLTSFFHLF